MRSCVIYTNTEEMPGLANASLQVIDAITGEVIRHQNVIYRGLPRFIVANRLEDEAVEVAREAGYDHIIDERTTI